MLMAGCMLRKDPRNPKLSPLADLYVSQYEKRKDPQINNNFNLKELEK